MWDGIPLRVNIKEADLANILDLNPAEFQAWVENFTREFCSCQEDRSLAPCALCSTYLPKFLTNLKKIKAWFNTVSTRYCLERLMDLNHAEILFSEGGKNYER